MRRVTLLIFVGLLAVVLTSSISRAQSPASSDTSELDKPIQSCLKQVASWRHEAATELTLVVAVSVFGILIATLQKSKDDRAKKATAVLGVVTAVLTGVNSRVFTADDRTLRRAAFDGDAVINQLWVKVGAAKDTNLPPEDRKTAIADYLNELAKFHAVGDKLNGAAPASGSTEDVKANLDVLPVVYAEQPAQVPVWVQNPPSDTATTLYFVGKAYDPSLTIAKQNSMDAALHNAVLALAQRAPNASGEAILDLIKPSAVLQDSTFAYEGKTANYAYYTLLRVSAEILNVVKSLPQATAAPPTKFQDKGWQPADLTSNATSGMFALDTRGGVSKLDAYTRAGPRIEKLFQLKGSDQGYALTANADSVFVASTSKLGCTLYRYSLATKAVSNHLVAVHERCVGIANDGTAIYVAIPDRKEIRYWDTWDATSYHTWTIPESGSPGYLVFDAAGHRLIIADDTGTAYAISVPDGRRQLLSGKLGAVQSLAASRFHVLVASGTRVLFLARSDNHGENLPVGSQTLPGGHIVGVAVDKSDKLWLADYDNKLVEGPFPLI